MIKELSESIIDSAREGEDVSDRLLTLAEELPRAIDLSDSDKALSMEAAAWFVGQRVAGAAVYMAESLLQISANLEAAKFLTTITRRYPFSAYKPALSLRDRLQSAVLHSYSFPAWVETHSAVRFETPRALSSFESEIASRIKERAPKKLLSIFAGDGVLEEALLEQNPEVIIHFAEILRFEPRFAALEGRFPGRVSFSEVKGRYDFGTDTYDVCVLHRLETYSDLPATLAYAFDRAPCLFTYALHTTRWPPVGQVQTPSGARYVALHGLDPEEILTMFKSLALLPTVVDVDGVLVAEACLEVSDESAVCPQSPEPGPRPENPSPK